VNPVSASDASTNPSSWPVVWRVTSGRHASIPWRIRVTASAGGPAKNPPIATAVDTTGPSGSSPGTSRAASMAATSVYRAWS
jgi:hypothetical protein